MKYDISALGNALVDTQYKVSHEFLSNIGMEADSMTLASAEEQNPIIEKLIEMALMDGEITAKEKKILIKKAENFRVDLDEFEMVLDARLYQKRKQISNEQINRNESNFIPPVSKSIKFGDTKKCPSCGSNVQSFQIKCADCDHEYRNIDVNSSIEKLFRKLNEAEDKRKEDYFY